MDFKSFDEVDRLTIPEYKLLMKAVRLKQLDKQHDLHLQAYLNLVVRAKKKNGKDKYKYVYQKFKQFFDYKKRLAEIENDKSENESQFSGIGKLLKKER